jgi:homospermidine synthase
MARPATDRDARLFHARGVDLRVVVLTPRNLPSVLDPLLGPGDFLLNLPVDVSSTDLIALCQRRGALYLDTCIEPWAGGYTDPALTLEQHLGVRVIHIAERDNQIGRQHKRLGEFVNT